jgi:hypothetical protein
MPLFVLCLVAAAWMVGPPHLAGGRAGAADPAIANIPLVPAYRATCDAGQAQLIELPCPAGAAGALVYRATCSTGGRLEWAAVADRCTSH